MLSEFRGPDSYEIREPDSYEIRRLNSLNGLVPNVEKVRDPGIANEYARVADHVRYNGDDAEIEGSTRWE